MKTIWKYEIPMQDYFSLQMPENSTVLCVQVQYRIPCIWAVVEDTMPKREYHFRLAGTGHNLSLPDWQLGYIGTFQLLGGELIFHLFRYYPQIEIEAKDPKQSQKEAR